MSDYKRPAEYQITHFYKCTSCKSEVELMSDQMPPSRCYHCKDGLMEFSGEAYPASSHDWHEERDNVNDNWRNPYNRRY